MLVDHYVFTLQEYFSIRVLSLRPKNRKSKLDYLDFTLQSTNSVTELPLTSLGLARLYARVALAAFTRRHVFWSTGPENQPLIEVVLWSLLSLLNSSRTWLLIRNIPLFCPDGPDLRTRIRGLTAKRLQLRIFDTHYQANHYRELIFCKRGAEAVLPSRIADFPLAPIQSSLSSTVNTRREVPLVIGLVGGIDVARRDYACVVSALKQLADQSPRTIEVRILGRVHGPNAEEVLRGLGECGTVVFDRGDLPEKRLLELAEGASILWAPLRQDLYGPHKASGAFGDAAFFKKHLLIPNFADPEHIYSDFCRYYETSSQAASALLAVMSESATPMQDAFDQFKREHVIRQLVRAMSQGAATTLTPS